MSHLNEDEADAFFHEGDAGTYDGGPALSLAPVGMHDLLEDEEFLCVKLDGHYARLTTGHHPHPAKADLGTDKHARKAS